MSVDVVVAAQRPSRLDERTQMDLFAFPPIAATLDAAYALLMGLAALLHPLLGAGSAAAAVILITLLVRTILIPAGVAQARADQTRARIAPRLAALQRRHKNDRERLQRETMKLYADEKASPFAGCLPVLIQAPIVGVIYALFLHTAIAGHVNGLLEERMFGVPLGTSVFGALGTGTVDPAILVVFGILIAVLAAVAEITRRTVSRQQATLPGALTDRAMLRLLSAFHFSTAVVALFVPLAAALYLVVTATWTLGQRLILRRIHPLAPSPAPPRG